MVVEKAAANFVQSGNFGTMKQTLKRAFDTPSSHHNQPQKVGRGNMSHKDNQIFTAESTSKSVQQNVQSCRHCGKNVIRKKSSIKLSKRRKTTSSTKHVALWPKSDTHT